MYVLRANASSQRGPAGSERQEQEEVKAPLEPHMSRTVVVQDEERAGTVLQRGYGVYNDKAKRKINKFHLCYRSKIQHYRILGKVKEGEKGRGVPPSPSFRCSYYAA